MVFSYLSEFNLQLFADGAGASGAPGADGANAGGADAGEPEAGPVNPKRSKRDPLANVRYGRQPESQPQAQQQVERRQDDAAEGDGDADADRAEWQQLKKGRFARFYGEDVGATVQSRLKNSKASQEALGKLAPVIEQLAKKTGKDKSDIDGIVAAFMDDDSLYEDEAIERGMDVRTLKQLKRLEAQNQAYQQQQQRTAQQQMFDQHLQKLAAEGEELKKVFPGFDLETELRNRKFAQMTSPSVGLSVADAYYAIHRAELEPAMIQATVQNTKQRIANAVQAGRMRPSENGTRRNAPGLDIRDDPKKWTKKDREEVRRRVARGQKIYL